MSQGSSAPHDPTGWIVDNVIGQFVLMNTDEIKYMAMFGYTFLHGCKVFKTIGEDAPFSYKFVYMLMACTGGGILVPIFINSIPVPLAQDAFPITIFISFCLHATYPILREIMDLSAVFRAAMVFLFETMRAFIVTKLTLAAAAAIPASDFSFPVYGPIFCGTIAGCGGAFLPFSKGLGPIKEKGMAPPMFSAFVAATFFHLYVQCSPDVVNVVEKGRVLVALYFILEGFSNNGILDFMSSGSSSGTPAWAIYPAIGLFLGLVGLQIWLLWLN
eukprot:Nitzschia sp. Nitz4//scaffold11_size288233//262597//263681//NITZ4_000820-RA/size288233-processed-gene-0.190-mRNA-1//1//CDS//3329534212//2538//frame0